MQLARVAQKPSRFGGQSVGDVLSTLVASVFLVVAGLLLALLALELLSASLGGHFSPWHYLGVPHTHSGRAAALAVVALFLALLMVVEVRRYEHRLAVAIDGAGSVLLPGEAVERLAEDVVVAHSEVVAVHARVTSREGHLQARVWAALRPGANQDAVAAVIAAQVKGALERIGLPVDDPRVRLKVLRVHELRKYL